MSTKHARRQSHMPQRGMIGILLLVTIAVMAVTVFSKNIWGDDSKTYQEKINREALRQAKAALLEYIEVGEGTTTSNNDLNPVDRVFSQANGQLPCPNQDGLGRSPNGCGTTTAGNGAGIHSLGLFPWSTLGLPVIRDAAHQCLWYAVDGYFKNSTASSPLNADSQGSFSVVQPRKKIDAITGAVTWSDNLLAGNVSGIASNDRIVAVIIAPGAAGGSQVQTSIAGNNPCSLTAQVAGIANAEASASNFLKYYISTALNVINNQSVAQLNANAGSPVTNGSLKTFLTADTGQEQLNDQMVWITAEEFAKAVTKRTARLYASAINSYVNANGYYPSAASTPGGTCIAGLLQGYVPYTCPQKTGGPATASLDTYLGSRFVGANMNTTNTGLDPDWWGAQNHYAVSQDCISQTVSANNGTAAVYGNVTFLSYITTAANPCRARTTRVNLGAGTNGPPAIILMRGRMLPSQTSCTQATIASVLRGPASYSGGSGGATANAAVNIAGCLEDNNNRNAVHNAFAGALNRNTGGNIANITYSVPSASSNDYLVQLIIN